MILTAHGTGTRVTHERSRLGPRVEGVAEDVVVERALKF